MILIDFFKLEFMISHNEYIKSQKVYKLYIHKEESCKNYNWNSKIIRIVFYNFFINLKI